MQSAISNLYVRRASAGSGKTYTLAAHYIALLFHGESYRSILAVTFTNKATAEMKERILNYLFSIARESDRRDTQSFLMRVREIYKELGYTSPQLTDEYCRQRAEMLFNQILADYDGMHVSTIDAFLQTLLAGMVQKLDGQVGYRVELDTKQVITDAVDQLLTEGARQPVVRQLLADYMGARMDQEKGWDIRLSLIRIAQELYTEAIQRQQDKLVTDPQVLDDFAESLDWKKHSPAEALQAALQRAEHFTAADFSYGKTDFLSRFDKFRQEVFDDFSARPLRAMTDADAWSRVYKGSENPESVRQELIALRDLVAQCRLAYQREQHCTAHLGDLKLMGYLREQIQQTLAEHNTRLLSETAAKLHEALLPGDADFILEKAGTRYRHIMLDEFQDTSVLQWDNFRMLVQELLSTEADSTLIVGDIKQSIYRWRNGDWSIMANLPEQWHGYYNPHVPQLVRNFRSEREVVRFNLETFSRLAAGESEEVRQIYEEGYIGPNLSDYYRPGHEHGYVKLEALGSMFDDMERLLAAGCRAEDMLILIRTKRESVSVLSEWNAAREDGLHPCLERAKLISNDSFHLSYSQSVNTLMAALKLVYRHDDVARAFLHVACPDVDESQFVRQVHPGVSLLDAAELAMRVFLCPSGEFRGQDLAYVNCFMDRLRSYIAKHGSDGETFVQYWEDILSAQSIPAGATDGIRMMTIHSAKGLEAKNVFIPFCTWEMESDRHSPKIWCAVPDTSSGRELLLPIPQDATMPEAGFAEVYQREHQLERIDNLNLLYVAFTRAAERLYIYLDDKSLDPGKKSPEQWNVGQLLADQYGLSADNALVSFGQELWPEQPSQSSPSGLSGDLLATYHSSESHIHFCQSQESREYGWDIATLPIADQLDQRAFGTICHDVLAMIGIYPTLEALQQATHQAVEDAFQRGMIPTDALRQQVEPLLLQTVSDPQLLDWFTGSWEVLREETVLFANDDGLVEERRMDRVMRCADTAIVLDYKFGQDNPKYDVQVRRYMDICRQLGYSQVYGYLYLAQSHKLVQI